MTPRSVALASTARALDRSTRYRRSVNWGSVDHAAHDSALPPVSSASPARSSRTAPNVASRSSAMPRSATVSVCSPVSVRTTTGVAASSAASAAIRECTVSGLTWVGVLGAVVGMTIGVLVAAGAADVVGAVGGGASSEFRIASTAVPPMDAARMAAAVMIDQRGAHVGQCTRVDRTGHLRAAGGASSVRYSEPSSPHTRLCGGAE